MNELMLTISIFFPCDVVIVVDIDPKYLILDA